MYWETFDQISYGVGRPAHNKLHVENWLETDARGMYRLVVMSTVQEIESAIEALPREDKAQLWNWWNEYRETEWDRQIEADLTGGKLDKLLDVADRDFEAGRCTPLP